MRHWFDAPLPEGTGACVSYVDTGAAWVAAGSPLAPPAEVARAAGRFVAAARRAGRRASFFAVERHLPGLASLPIGEQPVLEPEAWLSSGARSRGIREQLRRSRRKGVRVRRVMAGELQEGTSLREQVERLAAEWTSTRRMEPMGFLVSLEPFLLPDEQRYYVAERDGRAVAFLSAVPLYARRGWLVEDVLRGPMAPSGTTEMLIVTLAREARAAAAITLGLAPLSGRMPAWQRGARRLTRPLYDFVGVRAFKERLHPTAWEPVRVAFPEGEHAVVHLLDALGAFARGSLPGFALRTLARRPGALPWLISLLLGAWTVLLCALVAAGRPGALALDRVTLGAWAAFDAFLAALLFRLARRPRPLPLALVTALSAADSALYLAHLHLASQPAAGSLAWLRWAAAAGPIGAAVALGWATHLAVRGGIPVRFALTGAGRAAYVEEVEGCEGGRAPSPQAKRGSRAAAPR